MFALDPTASRRDFRPTVGTLEFLGERKVNKLIKVAKQTNGGRFGYQERSTPRGLCLIAQGFRTLGCAG